MDEITEAMYKLIATQDDEKLFFRLDRESVERHGAIGYFRADFAKNGREFHCSWFDEQANLKTNAFKQEFDGVINSLRDDGDKPPLASRTNLAAFCSGNTGKSMGECGHGFMVQTQDFSYYFRCKPSASDYDIYCFAYDNRYLLPELAGKHELPEYCYSIPPSKSGVIVVRNGETGCYGCQYNEHDATLNRKYVNSKNKELGVTRAQEEAMLAGSMFGWDKPAAKPWNYNQDGKPRPPQPKKNEPER